MTAKRREEFVEFIDNEPNEDLKTWVELYEEIENHGMMKPPYPEWYGHRPRHFKPSYFA